MGVQWPPRFSLTVWETISAICQNGYASGEYGTPNATCIPGQENGPGAGYWEYNRGSCLGVDYLEILFGMRYFHYCLMA